MSFQFLTVHVYFWLVSIPDYHVNFRLMSCRILQNSCDRFRQTCASTYCACAATCARRCRKRTQERKVRSESTIDHNLTRVIVPLARSIVYAYAHAHTCETAHSDKARESKCKMWWAGKPSTTTIICQTNLFQEEAPAVQARGLARARTLSCQIPGFEFQIFP